MPFESGIDKGGHWVRWGQSGKKYHYKAGSKRSKEAAWMKARKQRGAILATGWREDEKKASLKDRMRATLDKMKSAGKRVNRRPTYRIRYPKRLEEGYVKAVDNIVKAAFVKAMSAIVSDLKALGKGNEEGAKKDAADPVKRLVDKVQATVSGVLRGPRIEQAAQVHAKRVGEYNYNEVEQQFVSRIGISPLQSEPSLQKEYDRWTAENVDLITSIEKPLLDKVESVVRYGVEQGRTTSEMAKAIDERFGVGRAHARLIARDQVGKLFGNLTKERNEEAGVKSFIWRTSNDERVRESHQDLEGKEFTWEEGAVNERGEAIWPGTDIQCRCTAEPVFTDLMTGEREEPEEAPAAGPEVSPAAEPEEQAPEEMPVSVAPAEQAPEQYQIPQETPAEKTEQIAAESCERCFTTTGNNYEMAEVIKDGQVIVSREGQKAGVRLSTEEVKALANADVLIHNHPKGSSFSPTDIATGLYENIKELQVVTNNEALGGKLIFKMRLADAADRIKKDFPTSRSFLLGMKKIDKEVETMFTARLLRGEMTLQQASNLHYHTVWTKFAERYGVKYEVVKK